MATQNDIRTRITNQIVEALERGTRPWIRPWNASENAGSPRNAVSKRSYSGVNPLLLQIAADRHGFTSRWWGTFNQWKELGGQVLKRPEHVRPGEWGTNILFCKPVTKKTAKEDEETDGKFWLLRTFTVFNLDQVLGGELDHLRVENESSDDLAIEQRYEAAEEAVAATGADIRYGGDSAYYSPSLDFIQMPRREQFGLPEYYQTLLHELTHWSEHPDRLNWDRSKPENSYALGELIAELGGCYIAGELGLPVEESLENHAAYLRQWIAAMREDNRFLFRATAQATKAADYILSFSRCDEPAVEPELVA